MSRVLGLLNTLILNQWLVGFGAPNPLLFTRFQRKSGLLHRMRLLHKFSTENVKNGDSFLTFSFRITSFLFNRKLFKLVSQLVFSSKPGVAASWLKNLFTLYTLRFKKINMLGYLKHIDAVLQNKSEFVGITHSSGLAMIDNARFNTRIKFPPSSLLFLDSVNYGKPFELSSSNLEHVFRRNPFALS